MSGSGQEETNPARCPLLIDVRPGNGRRLCQNRYFCAMLQSVRTFLNQPLAEDFSLKNTMRESLLASLYVFGFLTLLNLRQFDWALVGGAFLLGAGCFIASLSANWLAPRLFPSWYDEERWTVGRHIPHTLFVLLCISVTNELLLTVMGSGKPPFWQMYLYVTLIGFFPITLGVLAAERRRFARNATQALAVNAQLERRQENRPALLDQPQPTITLLSDTGKEKLSLHPDQLVYVESVGNYVDVHWLNLNAPQKTVLRNTLKEVEAVLREYPQFFRCHRAFIVNLKAVNCTEGNARGYQLTLTGAAVGIPVSRSYLDAFDQRMAMLT